MRGIVLPENLIMRENENQRLIPEVYGAALEREDAAWTSSDERILKVDNGYLYPVSVGEATVTAEIRAGGRLYTASCQVTVEANTADVITAAAGAGDPLRFDEIQRELERECRSVLGSSLDYVGGLWVNTRRARSTIAIILKGILEPGWGPARTTMPIPQPARWAWAMWLLSPREISAERQ